MDTINLGGEKNEGAPPRPGLAREMTDAEAIAFSGDDAFPEIILEPELPPKPDKKSPLTEVSAMEPDSLDSGLDLEPIDEPEQPELDLEMDNDQLTEEDSSETIHFNDLPLIWQKHVLKRKEEKFLPVDQDTFNKQEILAATVSPDSWTDPKVVDKVFERAKKEKIPFDLLPKKWQEILLPLYQKEIETFGDVTIEALEKNGASAEDIKTLQTKAQELSRISDLKQQLAIPENSKSASQVNASSFVNKVLMEKAQPKKSLFSRFKGWFGF